ncbi:hypothetical protein Tco_1275869 [Tanacetum coccineum]
MVFADIANYHRWKFLDQNDVNNPAEKKILQRREALFPGEDPFLFKIGGSSYSTLCFCKEAMTPSWLATKGPPWNLTVQTTPARKVLIPICLNKELPINFPLLHPQTSGPVRGFPIGLEEILGEINRQTSTTSWSEKLDEALWAFPHLLTNTHWLYSHITGLPEKPAIYQLSYNTRPTGLNT